MSAKGSDVARVRLSVINSPLKLVDSKGVEVSLDSVRLHCAFLVGAPGQAHFRQALVDTASELSLFPERHWRAFESQIEWLTDRIISKKARVGGGEFPFRLGRITITVIQADLNAQLAPAPLLAQFVNDDEKLGHALLGLGGGFLRQRRLVIDPDLREARLEEVGDAP